MGAKDTKIEEDMNEKQVKKVDEMKELLRGEMSAVKAYEQVIEKLDKNPEAIRLKELLNDHQLAVSYWKRQVSDERIVSSSTSGAWDSFVKAFVGSAKLLGNAAALKALKEGEKHGLDEYHDFLKDETISGDQRDHVRKVLIPNQERHIKSIDAMMEK